MNVAIGGMIYSQKLPEFAPLKPYCVAPQPRAHITRVEVLTDRPQANRSAKRPCKPVSPVSLPRFSLGRHERMIGPTCADTDLDREPWASIATRRSRAREHSTGH